MDKNIVGVNAGKLWKVLDKEDGAVEFKRLKRKAKLRADETRVALGWLLKEDKINLIGVESILKVELK